MPTSSTRVRVGPYFAVTSLLLVVLYSLVFLLPGSNVPRLGLDLQGGTRVVLTPQAADDEPIDAEQLEEARRIIEQRVNGLGVAEASVTIEGDRNILIEAPGEDTETVKAVGVTAELQFRRVNQTAPDPGPSPDLSPDADPSDPATQLFAADCTTEEGVRAAADIARDAPPESEVVSCQGGGAASVKYLLGAVEVQGTDVSGAQATTDQVGGWQVNLSFTSDGQDRWTTLTEETVGEQVAIVLDGIVLSAPVIQDVIPGDAQITGNFTEEEAKALAAALNYGSLPLSFDISQATTVSATLGLEALQAGLVAGAIGLVLVFIYCLFYYRLLGIVVIASLFVAAAIIYPVLVLLGRSIGFTLTLAGVAGLIVAIGITADSFVVYFERIKDEMRSGRTMRSAVPRAWGRARRTIVTADIVSLIAAVILYVLSIGAVRGFAFTLGLSTLVDLLIVFIFTYPLVTWFSRRKVMRTSRASGLPPPAAEPNKPRPGSRPRSAVGAGKGA